MESHAAAHLVNRGDHLHLVRENELFVNLRADERGGGIAHAEDVDPGIDLGLGKRQLHLDDEIEQVANELRIVVEIEHQVVDAPQVGRLRAALRSSLR